MGGEKLYKYPVLDVLRHNGKLYHRGDEVEMTQVCATLCSAVGEAINKEKQATPLDDVIDAISKLEQNNENHWTKEGKPEVKALSAILNRTVTATERDEAWNAVTL